MGDENDLIIDRINEMIKKKMEGKHIKRDFLIVLDIQINTLINNEMFQSSLRFGSSRLYPQV